MKPLISYVPDDLIEFYAKIHYLQKIVEMLKTLSVYVVSLHTIYDKRQLSLRITQRDHPESRTQQWPEN
jgi:hypothetical protein